MRRKVLAILLAACTFGSVLAGCSSSAGTPAATAAGDTGDTIKLGQLEDASGDFSLVGTQKIHAAQLAVSEINAAGGVLGKQIELISPDCQSDNTVYQDMAKKLILEDKVAAIMGGYSSASREAIRPIIEQNDALLFYNNQYEGGVASHNVFCTGDVPEHQIVPLAKTMLEKFGKKAYIIAADYNFGQISADWFKKTIEENGGEVVGEEFIPLEVSQFSSTIASIQDAKPDFLVTLLVGTAQSSFYEQWAKSGIKGLPMASTVNIAQSYEHLRFEPPALANMYVTASYVQELDTPASDDFKERWHKMFPDEPYIGMEAEAEYTGVYLWKTAVEKAGTTDVEAVIKALESGVSYDGPSGLVTIDGKTHHAIRDIYLLKCDENHNITVEEKYDQVVPNWLSDTKGIDLTKEAPNEQYTPLDN